MDSTYAPHPPSATRFFPPPTSSSSTSILRHSPPNPRQIHALFTPIAPHNLSSNSEHKSNYHSASDHANINPDSNGNATAIDQHLGSPVFGFAGLNFHQLSPPASLAIQAPAQISPPYNETHFPYEALDSHIFRAPPQNILPSSKISGPEVQSPKVSNQLVMSSTRGSRSKNKYDIATSSLPSHQDVESEIHKIEIKTKFPVARIKRIMQADEEVGKVAQVTPVAVSKALELFMIALVSGAAEIARDKGSKKVSAQHLKMVVESQPERFDFLAEIVGKVGNNAEGTGNECQRAARKRKEESESMSEDERDKEKTRKKVRGRRKKLDE
ncbi:hypothetical protein K3495_g11396 [Podosphaera aphanis]|nr:hypothetical protein K3495_g11396 [Podosphaera aphanis]